MIPPPDPVSERLPPEHRNTEHSESFLGGTETTKSQYWLLCWSFDELTSSNNMAMGPMNRITVRSRGSTAAENSPAVFSPIISDREYCSNSSGLPNWCTKTGDIIVINPAETNLLLIVSG